MVRGVVASHVNNLQRGGREPERHNVDIVRGMALAAAEVRAKGDAVTTEVVEDFANEQLKVRVWIGRRSGVFAVYNADLERVQGDRTVARKVERLIQDELAGIPI